MFRPLTIALVSILWNYASAHNLETRETFPMYLRNGGSSYNASQEPAYAGYSFDVRLKSNVIQIIVGQPRSGVEGSTESPGALFSCEIPSFIGVDETTASYLATTRATTEVKIFASGDTTESPYWTTGVTNSTVLTTTAATPIDFIPAANCTRIEVFDQTDYSNRGTDHKNRADSLGLNIARIGNTEQYAVCAPLRLRDCPQDTTYSPGACYFGRPDENTWNFVKWNETECFNQIIEIIFVVDGSSSIADGEFKSVKKWLINVIKKLIATFGDSVRTEVLQFSNKDQDRYNIPIGKSTRFVIPYTLTEALPVEEIETKIENMAHISSQTYTHFALRRVMEWEFPQSEFYTVSKKMVVVLTDGEANDAPRFSAWYETYKEEITSFAVGVGNYVQFLSQLRQIANGDTGDDRVLTVNNFDELQTVVSTLTEQIESSVSTEGTSSSSSSGAEEDTRNRQLGTAIASDKNEALYFGAIGMYQDSGMVMKFDNRSESNPNEPTQQQVADALPEHTDGSYMGYTVVTGYFDGVNGSEYIATGAPRYKLLGAVVIYKPVKDDGALRDHVTLMAPNGKIASYFGGCLLSLDVSGDGKDDLFVGSPLYVGTLPKPYEGQVFVYISQETNSSNIWGGESFRPIELSGDHSESGRFGMAMANAGDLNLDGYNDVVIGAPLADDGQGAVFIYDGMKGGISKEPSQKIHASTFSGPTLKYFGQSLQGDIDVDGNQYPDIFVGAPRSDSIVLLRSRPIVKMYSTIEYKTVDVNIFECITKNYTNCTAIKVCLHANGTSVESSIGIRYNLTIDVGKTVAVEKRLEFPTTENQISTTIQLNTNQDYCFTKALNMKSGVARETQKSTMDYEAPVISTIEFDLLPSHVNTPFSSVRDTNLVNSNKASIYFAKECVNLICVPDLQLTGEIILPSRTIDKNGTEVDVTENGNILIIDTETRNKKTIVRMNVTNFGENSFETKLRVTYNSNTPISKVRTIYGFPKLTQCIIEDGSPISEGLLKIQEFRYNHEENIMTPNSTCYFEFDMITDALKDNGEMGNFTVKALVNSSSKSSVENDTTNNMWNKTTRIKYKSDFAVTKGGDTRVKFNYTEKPENITSVGDIGKGTDDISMNFKIVDSGPSKIPLSEITLTWPWLTKELTPLLYLHKVECSEKSETAVPSKKCVCNESKVNPYNLTTDEKDPNGTSGQVTAIPASVNITSELLNCTYQTGDTHSCESLKCIIYNLHQSEEVNFIAHFRLWTPSIRLNVKPLPEVKLQTDFEISSANSPHIVGADYKSTIVGFEEVVVTAEKYQIIEVPDYLWIYILAASAGTLLLAIIIILMWKCGFFNGNEYEKKMKEEQERLDEELNFPDNSNANFGAEGNYQHHSDWDGKRKLDGDSKFVEESDANNSVTHTDQLAINLPGAQSAAQLSQYDNLDGSIVDDEPDYDEPPNSEPESADNDTDAADVILPPPDDLDNEPDYDLPPDSQQKETEETDNEPLPLPPPVESGAHSNVVLLEDEK